MRFASNEQSCELGDHERIDFCWSGIVKSSDVVAVFGWIREQCAGWSRMFWLWDMTATQLLPGESRRSLLEEIVRTPLRATAVVTSEF